MADGDAVALGRGRAEIDVMQPPVAAAAGHAAGQGCEQQYDQHALQRCLPRTRLALPGARRQQNGPPGKRRQVTGGADSPVLFLTQLPLVAAARPRQIVSPRRRARHHWPPWGMARRKTKILRLAIRRPRGRRPARQCDDYRRRPRFRRECPDEPRLLSCLAPLPRERWRVAFGMDLTVVSQLLAGLRSEPEGSPTPPRAPGANRPAGTPRPVPLS